MQTSVTLCDASTKHNVFDVTKCMREHLLGLRAHSEEVSRGLSALRDGIRRLAMLESLIEDQETISDLEHQINEINTMLPLEVILLTKDDGLQIGMLPRLPLPLRSRPLPHPIPPPVKQFGRPLSPPRDPVYHPVSSAFPTTFPDPFLRANEALPLLQPPVPFTQNHEPPSTSALPSLLAGSYPFPQHWVPLASNDELPLTSELRRLLTGTSHSPQLSLPLEQNDELPLTSALRSVPTGTSTVQQKVHLYSQQWAHGFSTSSHPPSKAFPHRKPVGSEIGKRRGRPAGGQGGCVFCGNLNSPQWRLIGLKRSCNACGLGFELMETRRTSKYKLRELSATETPLKRSKIHEIRSLLN
eukprot:GILK01004770.1.p1 GENE.GILK01004770.1~~GILK01004770.1.p1  ORF type:complete len:356 (+),score=17.98 GILK01004770.1:63-1130(+)